MKEKPILFSTPMVQAILEGRKTQTRRVIKPQLAVQICVKRILSDPDKVLSAPDPRYKPGDILWVREGWRCLSVGKAGNDEIAIIEYKNGQQAAFDVDSKQALYFAGKARWRPSIHMPRKAARIFLEVKSVRVERLQDISEEDAEATGVRKGYDEFISSAPLGKVVTHKYSYKKGFKDLWDSLNAKRGYSWDRNPWVWTISFGRIK